MLTVKEARKLADAVQSWLDFQILCDRDALLSEAYLAQPVGEFLISHHTGETDAEVNHPSLPRSKRGRSRQVDYVLRSKDNGTLVSAIEAKWVRSRTVSRQRIVDDVLRLESLRNDSDRSAYRYFVVAGRSRNIEKKFLDLGYNTGNGNRKNFVDQILPISETDTDKHVRIDDAGDGIRKYYQRYAERYSTKSTQVLVPKSYKTTLIADMTEPDSTNGSGRKARVMIWRIKSVRGRSEMSLRN